MTSHRRMGRARRDENSFKIRPASAGGFVAFEAALARKLASLATLPERHGVILTLDGGEGNYFTQALVDHECGAWLEAVSNEFITEGHELDDDQHRLLAAFGLNPPDGCPNHHLALALPTDWHHAAALLVRPLEAVYGATRHTLICVEVLEVGRGSPFGPAEADDIAAEAFEGSCPSCEALDPARMLFGMPAGWLPDWLAVGGCVIGPDRPSYQCRTCGHRW